MPHRALLRQADLDQPERIARAWGVLMKRLGYTRYAARGDWGAVVGRIIAFTSPRQRSGRVVSTWQTGTRSGRGGRFPLPAPSSA